MPRQPVVTPYEVRRAVEMRRNRMPFREIAEKLGRHTSTVTDAIRAAIGRDEARRLAAGMGPVPIDTELEARLFAEREERKALRRRNLTAALMGDPEVGRSALDRRAGT